MTRDSVTKDAQCSLYREVKIFYILRLHSCYHLDVFLFSMAPINCSQGEKEVESGDAHHQTDLIRQLNAYMNRKFSSKQC